MTFKQKNYHEIKELRESNISLNASVNATLTAFDMSFM